MPGKSDTLEIEYLKLVTGQTPSGIFTLTAALTPYLALFTASPGESTAGTEVTGTGYARVLCGGTTFWNVPAAGAVTNKLITFPTAGGDWAGPITSFALMTAVSAGTVLMFGNLTVNKTVLSGDTPSFAAGQLSLTED